MKVIFIVIFSVLTFCQVQCIRNGKTLNKSSKIAGGNEDFTDMNVAAFITDENIAVCSGAYIANKWVLTAASCVSRYSFLKLRVWFWSGSVDYLKSIAIQNVYIHPDYNTATLDNDLALVNLDRSDQGAIIIAVPVEDSDFNGNYVIAKGFGKTNTAQDPVWSEILRSQITSVIEINTYCQRFIPMTANKLCTPDPLACEADVGGILTTANAKELIGIISVSRAHAFQCSRINVEPYTTYIKVVPYRNWIRQITDIPV